MTEPFENNTNPVAGKILEKKPIYSVTKDICDILTALLSLLVLSPVILIFSIIIRLTGKGPVIFTQDRVGKNGKPFAIYKFRSMVSDAEQDEPLLSEKNGGRSTPIGKFMRKYRIDEIPNFINVIKGEMSVVGPRPERQYFIDQIIKMEPSYIELQRLKPGITSWGQVKYGYASNVGEMIERLQYDLYYLKNRSFWLDAKIVFLTFMIIFKGKGI